MFAPNLLTQPQRAAFTRPKRRALLLLILLSVTTLCVVYAPQSSRATTSPLSSLTTPQSPLPEVAAMVPPTPLPPIPMPIPTQPPPSPLPTPKVLQPPVVIDLAQGWLKEFIFTFFVERADGRQHIYYVPITSVPFMQGKAGQAAYARYRQALLELEEGDRVVYECASPTMWTVPEEYRCFGRKQVTLNTPP